MRYVYSLRVFKQMDEHNRARIHYYSLFYTYTHARAAFIYSFIHYRCIDLKVQLITAVSAVFSKNIYQECVAR